MKVLAKATRSAIVWWIVLPLTLVLTASVSAQAPEIVPMLCRRLLVLAFVSVTAGTLVGYEDSNDVPATVVGWIGTAIGCTGRFSSGWLWEAGIFGMFGCYVALVFFYALTENWDFIEKKWMKLKRRLKRESEASAELKGAVLKNERKAK